MTTDYYNYAHTTTVLRLFFRDHPSEPVPEENFWTSRCKGRLTEADTQTIWLGATPSGLTSAHHNYICIIFKWQLFICMNTCKARMVSKHSWDINLRCKDSLTVCWRCDMNWLLEMVSFWAALENVKFGEVSTKEAKYCRLCRSDTNFTKWLVKIRKQSHIYKNNSLSHKLA